MIGNVGQLWRLISEVNPAQVREEAEEPFVLALCGPPALPLADLGRALAGWPRHAVSPDLRLVSSPLDGEGRAALASANAILLALDRASAQPAADRELLGEVSLAGPPFVVALIGTPASSDGTGAPGELDWLLREFQGEHVVALERVEADLVAQRLAPALVEAVGPAHRLSLGRHLPATRAAVAERLLRETCLANAQFALVSNLPANVPLVGGIVGDFADLIVLTKNQALLIVKLAAIYGRDLRNFQRLALEIAPVVGGAFLWRTAARMLVGLMPTFVAAVPKTAVAYVGTWVVGRIAATYYARGLRPGKALLASFRDEGLRHYLELLPGFGHREDEG